MHNTIAPITQALYCHQWVMYNIVTIKENQKVRDIGWYKKKRDKIGMEYESLHIMELPKCAMPTSQ